MRLRWPPGFKRRCGSPIELVISTRLEDVVFLPSTPVKWILNRLFLKCRFSFSSSSALWSWFKSNNVFSVIHLRSSLNGSKIVALIRLPAIWSQQRHNAGTKGRSIEIRSQFASTPWFGSFQNQATKTFFSILYQIRFNENGCLNSKIQSVLPTSSTCSRTQLHMSLHVTAPLL